ncbi:MAG: electron transport complex subunit RsxC [Clostridia bacterium]|nr:electron transport complex subunit RsxC [Clostridia bacterium]
MPLFKLGKAKVPHLKNTAAMPAVRMPAPAQVTIPMAQHIGAPALPCVKVGDRVYVGTKIGEAQGYVSSPVHSSVSGTVKQLSELMQSNGRKVTTVIIESDGLMELDPAIAPPRADSLEEFVIAVRDSGLVGLGGAGFPTYVKLDAKKKTEIDKIVINAAECEPYITSDTRTMLDMSEQVVSGVKLIQSFISAKEVIIGIESNKQEAIAKMREAFIDEPWVSVVELPSKYPQGGEKILIYNLTGRIVPEGGLPADVGVLVMNVTSVAFVGKYFETGIPLTEKCITFDGGAVNNPQNIIAPIGTSIADIAAFAGGYKESPSKLLLGGPMMGVAVFSDSDPILKNTNAITALSLEQCKLRETTACIHCGRCVSICPMGLNPTAFSKAMALSDKTDRAEMLIANKVNLCIECGCCSYVCPAKRPLVENNRLGKAELRAKPNN